MRRDPLIIIKPFELSDRKSVRKPPKRTVLVRKHAKVDMSTSPMKA